MNEYKDTADKTEIYLAEFLVSRIQKWGDVRVICSLVSLISFVICILLLRAINEHLATIRIYIFIFTLGYLLLFSIIAFIGIKKFKCRHNEVFLVLKFLFDFLKTICYRGVINSVLIRYCLLIFGFLLYIISCYIIYNNLVVLDFSTFYNNKEGVMFAYGVVVLLSNYYLFGGVCIYVCFVAKINNVLN